jgi:hypothetical protein
MLTVCCVCKSGGVYTGEHVAILEAMVSRHLARFDRFCCLSDVPLGLPRVDRIPLAHDFPGWWSKVELGRDLFTGRILYFDLDVVITEDLTAIASRKEPFIVVGDVYRRGLKAPRHLSGRPGYQSSIMAWDASVLFDVYRDFARTPDAYITKHARIGDQELLEMKAPRAAYWEDLVPGQIVSAKVHCKNGLPATARIVDFHGNAKPWQSTTPWVKEHYHV